MAAILLFFFLLIAKFSVSTAQENITQISLGSSLSPATNKSFWLSNSGQFAFGFYQQGSGGFSVGIWFEKVKQKTVVWTANRDDPALPPDTKLLLSRDGRLVLQDAWGVETLIANASQPAASASMLDSGNFVLYSSNSIILWQSFDCPTDTLLPGQRLVADEKGLISSVSETDHSSGRFKLLMQSDGNLVQYPIGNGVTARNAYWNTVTQSKGKGITLNLDPNGLLSLVNSTGFNIMNINVVADQSHLSKNVIYRFTIDVDGILRLYNHSLVQDSNWNVMWSSTSNRCDPTGFCGLNSFCSLIDQEPHCLCLPGFDFTDQNQKSLGCGRNSSVDFCTTRNDDTTVSLEEFDGVMWEDNSYSVVSSSSKADCEKNCLGDCNCEIALFMDQLCNKQMFPMRFSKAAKDGPVTTIVKVRSGTIASPNQATSGSHKEIKKGQQRDILIVGIVCATFTSTVLLFCVFLACRRHFWSHKRVRMESNEGMLMIDEEVFNLRSFTYNELELATNGFGEELGRGAFGTVFKGILPNSHRVIAVKRLEKVAAEGEVEFRNEMRSIGRTHHRNLLRLVGYCDEGSNRLLVYDYMINGSLSKFLFNSETKPNWDERIRIALGIARGILYLHEECENQIIHCDINPNNILIDENHNAKIADFGLAKLLMPDQTRTVTGIRGTRGFISPEWHKNMPITAKADVYSFGVVLMVIMCCRRSVDVNVPEREAILVDWVYECFRGNEVRHLVGDEEVDEQELERMVRIGLWCIQEDPTIRPAMKKVVAMFEGTVDIPVPPNLTSYHSASTED